MGGAAAALPACGGGGSNAPAPAPNSTFTLPGGVATGITIDQSAPSTTLGSAFAGLSYEKGALSNPLFSAANANLIGLFKALGSGIVRIGGNSVDRTTWNQSGAGLSAGQVSAADVNRLAGFLSAAGWRAIYGINFAGANGSTASPALAASEASYVASQLGAKLLGFEIGNEPDLYGVSNANEPSGYSYGDFLTGWRSFASAIARSVAGAVFTAPAAASDSRQFAEDFARDEAGTISLMTEHYYIGNGATGTMSQMLAYPDTQLQPDLTKLASASSQYAVPYRLAEANSFYNGGAPGISDAFGSALWAINFLFTLAQNSAVGANFHGGGNSSGYTPIADDGNGNVVGVRPLYYGIYLFAKAANGRLLAATVTQNGVAFSGFAVAGADGSTYVVANNFDLSQTAAVTVAVGKSASQAVLTSLTAPSTASTTGVTFGGSAIGLDGSWTPIVQQTIGVLGGSFGFSLPPGSAVVARVT